jgi:hypothetical protein
LGKRVGIVTSTILGVIALLTVVYKLDSYNIRVTSDPVYAKDSDLSAHKKEQNVKIEQLKSQLNMQQQIRCLLLHSSNTARSRRKIRRH